MSDKKVTDKEKDVNDIPSLFELKHDDGEKEKPVPKAVVRRLPRYYRFLRQLLNRDVLRISSSELSALTGNTPSQIRQDLSCFGDLGQQGYGYNVKNLYMKMSRILGVDKKYSAVIVGSKLAELFGEEMTLEMRGVRLRAVFDLKESAVGKEVCGLNVKPFSDFEDFCCENEIDIVIISVLGKDAVMIAESAKRANVRGVWNFSLTELEPIDGMSVQNLHTGDSLMMLMYDMNTGKTKK